MITNTTEQNLSVADFNFALQRVLHPSWYAQIPFGQRLYRYRDSQACAPRLNAILIDHFNLTEQELPDFANPGENLLLIPCEKLWQLTVFCGLTIMAPSIQRLIQQRERLACIAQIGASAYQFALRKSPHIAPVPRTIAATAPQGDWATHAQLMRESIELIGIACIANIASGFGPTTIRKLALRFPSQRYTLFCRAAENPFTKEISCAAFAQSVFDQLPDAGDNE